MYIQRTESQIVNQLLDSINWPTSQRIIDTSCTQLYYFWSENADVLQGFRNLETMSGGTVYIDHEGNLVWESRNYRSIYKSTPSATFDNTMFDLVYELTDRDIFNHIVVSWTPLEPAGEEGGGGIADITCKYNFPSSYPWFRLGYQSTNEHKFYTKGSKPWVFGEEAASWSNVQALVYQGTINVTNQMTIYIKKQTQYSCTVAFGNFYYDVTYPYLPHILWLSVDYTPLQTPDDAGDLETPGEVEVEDSTSIGAYGRRTRDIHLPYPMEREDALALANFYLNYYKDPVGLAQMTLKNETDANLLQIFNRHISDRITVVCDRLGLLAMDFFINKIDHRISQDGYEITSDFYLEKAATQRQLWVLDISALSSNTRLAP